MPKKIPKQYEADEQAKLFEWAEYMTGTYPALEWMHHIPNGGSRNKIEAANLKKQGVKPGVPDIFLPAPRGKYHGLYIEMKVPPNKPTAEQLAWLENLNKQGYGVKICYSCDEAIKAIERYLSLPDVFNR